MGKYTIKRLLLLIPTVLLVCVIVFSLMRLVPGSAVDQIIYTYQQNGITITHDQAAAMLGLDKPALTQFVIWFKDLLQGNMGTSVFQSEPVMTIIARRLPPSIELGVLTLLFTTVISVPLGLYCASHQDSVLDNAIRVFGVILSSLPLFWIGVLVLVYPAVWWGWTTPIKFVSLFDNPLRNMRMFLAPALLGSITQAGMQIRAVRTITLEVMRQDYIRTAWSKGIKERRVMFFHAFRNSLIPFITMFGGAVAGMVGGNVILESMFNIPGIGQQMVTALTNRDYPLVQGCTIILAVFVMVVNLIVDIAYKWCDPRGTRE
jgi:peptide/nickel transport system permease protein